MLIFDLETDGLLDEVTKIHCLVIKDDDVGVVSALSTPEEIIVGLNTLMDSQGIIGQNIVKYDIPVIQKLYSWWKPPALVRDTILCTRLIWPDIKEKDFLGTFPDLPKQLYGRHSLEAWGYRLGNRKGDFGKNTDWKEFTPEMLTYCIQDVEVTAALWAKIKSKSYSAQAIELEHQFAHVIALQERRGFAFDRDAAIKLYSTLGQRRLDLEKQLEAMFPGWYTDMKTPQYYVAASGVTFVSKKAAGKLAKEVVAGPVRRKHTPFNPSSRDHVARVLIENRGWKPKEYTPDGRPTVDESVLSELPFPEAQLLNEYFGLAKMIGQLAEGAGAWLKLEKKGRIHGEVITNGAITGRCTHRKPNCAQIPKVGSPWGRECRSLFTASPGYVLVGADLAGIELRCLGHYAFKYDDGAFVQELLKGDIHSANQRAAGLPTRDNAKTFIYGWLYGAGDAKIGAIINKGAKEGKRLREQFLEKMPALKRLKQDVAIASKRGYLVGLDGRHLPIRSEHSALNTLLQSAGAVIAKKSVALLYEDLNSIGWEFGREWGQVGHYHDESQTDVKEELSEEYGKRAIAAMRRAGEHFGFRCPIDGEFKIGRDWAGTH